VANTSVDPLEELVAPDDDEEEDDETPLEPLDPLEPLEDAVAPDDEVPLSAGSTLPPHAATSEAMAGRRTRRRRWWRMGLSSGTRAAPAVPQEIPLSFQKV
jgi:hypothetical protein